MTGSFSRRRFLSAAVAAGAMPLLPGTAAAASLASKRLIAGTPRA